MNNCALFAQLNKNNNKKKQCDQMIICYISPYLAEGQPFIHLIVLMFLPGHSVGKVSADLQLIEWFTEILRFPNPLPAHNINVFQTSLDLDSTLITGCRLKLWH